MDIAYLYQRFLFIFVLGLEVLLCVVSLFGLILILCDLFFKLNWGYTWHAVMFDLVMVAASFFIIKIARFALARTRRGER